MNQQVFVFSLKLFLDILAYLWNNILAFELQQILLGWRKLLLNSDQSSLLLVCILQTSIILALEKYVYFNLHHLLLYTM